MRTDSTKSILLSAMVVLLLAPLEPQARKFFDDDPLLKEPTPRNVLTVAPLQIGEASDFFKQSFSKIGERHTRENRIRARGINTLDEVPDSSWYTNRHYRNPMPMEELVRGPERAGPPVQNESWKVVGAKTEGVTPGFTIKDSSGRKYLLKFDPPSNPEMASAADVITSKFLHALGYNVPENYIVYFTQEQLAPAEAEGGGKPIVNAGQINRLLDRVPRDSQGRYRAMASLFIEGEILGPFQYYGMREDDPNDIVPHEHLRELRGLHVFAAWLGHTDAKSQNTLDTLVEQDGVKFVKHYLVDFGSSLGSAAYGAKDPRTGFEHYMELKPGALQAATLGLSVPSWARADFGGIAAVGRLEWEVFEPETWKPNSPIPAFENRLPDDTFWAAKQVMAFTDEQIRAIVKTGAFSDPQAEEWIARALIERRNKIGRAYFSSVLPLDRFDVRESALNFENLAVQNRWSASPNYLVEWSRFDNLTETMTPLAENKTLSLPRALQDAPTGEYFAAQIRGNDPGASVTVYIRKQANGVRVVGVERDVRAGKIQGLTPARQN